MNIVIAEDDPIALELLRESLLADGHHVQTANNGEDAFSLIEQGDARVLISDWEMPRMTGPELCRRVRGSTLSRYVFIIMLTGRNAHGDLVEGLRAGADDFLTKPFDPLELSVRLGVAERITSLETRDLMIFGMAKLAESRDRDTGAHLERVRSYCHILAEHLSSQERFSKPPFSVDREFVRLIFATSPLHDIGKVGIPDAILLKSDRLMPAEFEVMKSHTIIGAQTLDAALKEFPEAKFLHMARDIALCHHEKWDGSGYPNGIAADKIPLSARIVAVADVYDALRSARVYKQAQTHAKARETIVSGSGRHFDPDIVGAFLATEERFESVAKKLADVAEEPMRLAA
jgi:putative two-component system response regulator